MINQKYNQEFTLFLDRDGVINKRLPGQYVRLWQDFLFLPGVLQSIATCSKIFGRLIVITNQQGIGKGLMTPEELETVHQKMLQSIQKAGGRIDAIYYCPDLRSQQHNCRKPSPQMALQAKKDFPDINFSKSIMIGDSASDIQFGEQLGMETVFISSNLEEVKKITQIKNALPDHSFYSLQAWQQYFLPKVSV